MGPQATPGTCALRGAAPAPRQSQPLAARPPRSSHAVRARSASSNGASSNGAPPAPAPAPPPQTGPAAAARPARGSKSPSALKIDFTPTNDTLPSLVAPIKSPRPCRPSRGLLVFLPGMDGTGLGVTPQLAPLQAAGYEVRTLYLPIRDRSSWEQLTQQVLWLCEEELRRFNRDAGALGAPSDGGLTLVGESFGGALALRVASRAREGLLRQMVLINPGSSFPDSLGGLSSAIAATNLLRLFPGRLFAVAQAVLLPLLVDRTRVRPGVDHAVKAMMEMNVGAGSEVGTDAARSLQSGVRNLADSLEASLLDSVDDLSADFDFARDSAVPGGRVAREPDDPSTPPLELAPPVDADLGPLGVFGGEYLPAGAASHRLSLLREGVSDDELARVSVRTFVIASAKDKLLPSTAEAARLVSTMPRARRVILPDASHSALLERGVDLVQILRHNAVLPARHGRQADQDGGHAGGARGAEEDAWDEGSRSDGVGPTGVPRATMEQWEAARRNLAPLRALTDPVMLGTENIPLPGGPREQLQRPVLLVGNHTQYGFYDLPLLLQLLYDRGVKARGLGHPGHWQSPLGTLFERFGAVPANGRNMLKLLSRNECVLLFPGGAREVNKRKGEAYRLFWSDTPDLVRIAARANAIIVPFTALGGDDAFELFMDTDEVLNAPVLGPAVKTLYSTFAPFLEIEESVYPVPALPLPKWLPGPRLPFPLPVPRIQRIYFKFHAPVDVGARCCAPRAPGRGRARPDVEKCAEVYAEVQDTIRGGVSELQELRARDPGRFLSVRLLAQARAYLPDAGLPDGRADPRRQV